MERAGNNRAKRGRTKVEIRVPGKHVRGGHWMVLCGNGTIVYALNLAFPYPLDPFEFAELSRVTGAYLKEGF